MSSLFTTNLDNQGVFTLSLDIPGESMNVLNQAVVEEVTPLLDEIKNNVEIKAVILTSGKPGSFIAGADINMLSELNNVDEGTQVAASGQATMQRIGNLGKPFIAAIDGACLGGGYELALACHYRIATDNKATKIGLPEVMLGLLPGATGTTKLSRMIPLTAALDLLLSGKQLNAKRSLKQGLVDEVVPESYLQQAAHKAALKLIKNGGKAPEKEIPLLKKWQQKLMAASPIKDIIINQAKKQVLKKTKGVYPAPLKILEVVKNGLDKPLDVALALEARAFGELTQTPESKQLINIYFATNELKKESYVGKKIKATEVQKLGILGGGLMGAGIATVSIDKADSQVRLKDIADPGVISVYKQLNKYYDQRVKRRILSREESRHKLNQITTTLDYSGFKSTELVIEAVFEDLKVKQQMVSDIEAHANENTVFASNTSSIPLHKIAEGAKRPENILGMHYFSPVEKMPLLEIIRHEKTSDQALATALAYGRRQGKTVIVVEDGAGFYVNRILAPYMNAAMQCGFEGVAFGHIDKAMTKFGFPVGPFKLVDEVGIDISAKIQPILVEAFGERMQGSNKIKTLIDNKRLGRKTNKGFYNYNTGKGKKSGAIDETVYEELGISPSDTMSFETIQQRTVFLMLNEAAMCLDEGIISSPRDGDIGAIFGIGFPPFLGGPFRYMDKLGASKVVDTLKRLQASYGDNYSPCTKLVAMAEKGKSFYS